MLHSQAETRPCRPRAGGRGAENAALPEPCTERRARALEDVLLPEITDTIHDLDEVCETFYKDRGGKCQDHAGATLPKT